MQADKLAGDMPAFALFFTHKQRVLLCLLAALARNDEQRAVAIAKRKILARAKVSQPTWTAAIKRFVATGVITVERVRRGDPLPRGVLPRELVPRVRRCREQLVYLVPTWGEMLHALACYAASSAGIAEAMARAHRSPTAVEREARKREARAELAPESTTRVRKKKVDVLAAMCIGVADYRPKCPVLWAKNSGALWAKNSGALWAKNSGVCGQRTLPTVGKELCPQHLISRICVFLCASPTFFASRCGLLLAARPASVASPNGVASVSSPGAVAPDEEHASPVGERSEAPPVGVAGRVDTTQARSLGATSGVSPVGEETLVSKDGDAASDGGAIGDVATRIAAIWSANVDPYGDAVSALARSCALSLLSPNVNEEKLLQALSGALGSPHNRHDIRRLMPKAIWGSAEALETCAALGRNRAARALLKGPLGVGTIDTAHRPENRADTERASSHGKASERCDAPPMTESEIEATLREARELDAKLARMPRAM